MALKPILHPLDQTSEFAVVSNAVVGADITLMKAGASIATAQVSELELGWRGQAMMAFEDTLDLQDKAHKLLWQGDFTGSGKTEILLYSQDPGRPYFNWWLGTFTGDKLTWRRVGDTKGFGDLLDTQHPIWIGDFTGGNQLQVLFYYNIDHHWWLGTMTGGGLNWVRLLPGRKTKHFLEALDGNSQVHIGDFAGLGKQQVLVYFRATGEWRLGTITGAGIYWHTVGETSGFGDLLDGQHPMWFGWFAGLRNPATGRLHQQILFNYSIDGRWWLGTIAGEALTWAETAKKGFGDLLDGQHPLWLGDFSGHGHTDVLFHNATNGEWHLGTTAGSAMIWNRVAIRGFGNLLDGRHRTWLGDFAGLGRDQLLFYYAVDGNWWFGEMTAGVMKWSLAANTLGFGDLLDKNARMLWQGGFGGNGRQSLVFYYNGDGNWWHGQIQGTTMSWSLAGNTRGFGNLLDAHHHLWSGRYTGSGKSEILLHYRDFGRFHLGQFDGAQIPLPQALEPGDEVQVTQTIGTAAPLGSDPVTVSHNFATQHYDRARTGWNFRETALKAGNVHTLRKLYIMPTDDQIYTQPLYVENIQVGGELHNVIYVATASNTVYAFDADSNVLLLRHNLLRPGEQSVPSLDIYPLGNANIFPVIGIIGTPVIDCATGSLFVVSKCKSCDGKYHQRLHSLDLHTLGERPCVAEISASVLIPGTVLDPSGALVPDAAAAYDSLSCNQRCALLLSKGLIYVAFGSHGDQHAHQYHGWVLAFDTRTLSLQAAFNAAPADLAEGGIWQSGHGPAADASGNVYCTTGNGIFDLARRNFSNCVIKLSPRLGVLDKFAVADQTRLNKLDMDLGSGGVMVLPDQSSTPQRLLLTGGKEGYIYLLDRDHLGGQEQSTHRQGVILYDPDLSHEAGNPEGSDGTQVGVFGGPAYFATASNHFVFVCGQQGRTKPGETGHGQLVAYKVASGALSNRRQSARQFPGGGTPAVTGKDANAVVWMLDRARTLKLVALRASDFTQLFEDAAGTWTSPTGAAFVLPTIMKGKVYAPSAVGVTVFSL